MTEDAILEIMEQCLQESPDAKYEAQLNAYERVMHECFKEHYKGAGDEEALKMLAAISKAFKYLFFFKTVLIQSSTTRDPIGIGSKGGEWYFDLFRTWDIVLRYLLKYYDTIALVSFKKQWPTKDKLALYIPLVDARRIALEEESKLAEGFTVKNDILNAVNKDCVAVCQIILGDDQCLGCFNEMNRAFASLNKYQELLDKPPDPKDIN